MSSGLAGRFPAGYPVGVVSAVTSGQGEAFAQVQVRPSAQLDRSRHVLVLFESTPEVEAADAATGELLDLDRGGDSPGESVVTQP